MSTTAYLDVSAFKAATVIPAAYVDAVDTAETGWTLNKLTFISGWLDARLAKRYATPFTAPFPFAIRDWLERIVTWSILLKRGADATDVETSEIKERATTAIAEVKEAADSEKGLFELPLRDDT